MLSKTKIYKKTNVQNNRLVMLLLLTIFAIYNIILYTSGASQNDKKLSKKALNGQELWQEHNCTACHQFYGLGGYLGPDLTNVFSDSLKTQNDLKNIINSGILSMPKYSFTDKELDEIIAFLKAVDQTGYYPNNNATTDNTGWVEIETKKQD